MDTNLGLARVNALLIDAYSDLFPVYNKQTALHTSTRRVLANNSRDSTMSIDMSACFNAIGL